MEVITLQFGHFANHVGAHYWNLQDEAAAQEESAGDDEEGLIDHTRLFHAAESHGQLSWRPRAMVVDRAGALGAVVPAK
ncbi:MSTO1, partial [Symbiodinium natans]